MTLRVFEAFAGVGTQRMALERLGIKHEIVGIAEVDEFAINSYAAIHEEGEEVVDVSEDEMRDYLRKLNIPLNDQGKLKNPRGKKLKNVYTSSKKVRNLGDISKINVENVPDHDLFTYSFPCQDISLAGELGGLKKGSGTRSSLLWECKRVIDTKRPKYLLMENVKNLVSKKFKPHFEDWLKYLETLGYTTYWEVLNAKDYGVPQNRERVFAVSVLGEHEPYVFPKPIQLEKRLKDVLEDEVAERYYLDDERAKQLIATITDSNEIGYVPYKKDGKQHQSNTVYDKEKVAPTIEARDYKGAKQILEPKVAASRGRGKNNEQQLEVNKDDTSNALTTVEKDNYVLEGIPIKNNTDQGYLIAKEGDGVDLAYPTSNTRRGRVQENISQTLTTDDSKGVVELIAKEKFGRMGEQAVRTQNKLRLPHGETLNPWNEEQSSTNGVAPTLTTRPEGFKTAINVTDQYRIRKLTPLE